jgi:hypothetical protein
MREIRIGVWLGVVALLSLPAAALAGVGVTVNPERLNGIFDFDDKDEQANNTLEFEMDGRDFGATGQVQANAGVDVVTITYLTDFPNKTAASDQSGSVAQSEQVRVVLQLTPGEGSTTPAYTGQGAPTKCKAQAKLRDAESNDPDDPDKAQAKLTCDLGKDFSELDDDADPNTPGDPPPAVLEAVEAAFDSRKDVKVDTSKGKLQIKHNGEPAPQVL